MDYIADAIALLALILSVVGFFLSRSKASEADETAKRAERIAEESKAALQKVADETAEANAIARATLPPSPWSITLIGTELSIRNASSNDLVNVIVEQLNGNDLTPYDEESREQRQLLHPNQRVLFAYGKTLDSPAAADLRIRWRNSDDGPVETWYDTLS